jgi:glycosyltransferase involved in cell wall biosynthesis
MRIMHVIDSLEHGGAEAVVVDLANACSRDHEVTVCCARRRGDLANRLAPEVEFLCLDRPEGNDFTLPVRLARVARRRQIDVLHSHSWGLYLETAAAAWLAGSRTVHTVHGPYLKQGRGAGQRFKARVRRILERLAARRGEAIACVTTSLQAFVTDDMRLGAKACLVHNGIPEHDASEGSAPPPSTDEVRRLVSVGRLASIKRYDVLLRAFAEVSQHRPRLRLTLVGDGPERQNLERLAERLCIKTSVDFVGFRDDIPELLQQQDLFVLSSQHEGISIAILEAMRAGLPVVATRVGGVPDTVVDGVTGVLVPVDCPRSLAATIGRLLETPANLRAMGAAGRAVQRRRFSVARMREQYLELYGTGCVAARLHGTTAMTHRPLRILYHHRTQGRGAEGVHIASIVRALSEMGHEVSVLGPPGVDALTTAGSAPVDKSTVRTRGAGSLWKFISRRAPGWLFELAEIGYNALAWWRLRQAWQSGGYDLIYERYAFYMVAGARFAARRRVPFVLEANEVNGLEERARRQAMPTLCARFEAQLFARSTGILTVSSYLRRRILEQGTHPHRVRVVPNAIDPAGVSPSFRRQDGSGHLRQQYGLTGKTVIGFCGWFDHWDRLDLLLDAIHELAPDYPELAAMLIGDGPVAPRLVQQAHDLGIAGRVVFTGAVPRNAMSDHLALLDAAVLPHSNRFGSPVVLFEFMGQGLPIVAPRLDPITDVLRDGVTGALFDPLDPGQLIAAIATLLESVHLRRRLGATARDRVLSQHTWTHNAAEILNAAGYQPPAAPEEVRLAS